MTLVLRGALVAAFVLVAGPLDLATGYIGSDPGRVMLRGIGGVSPRQDVPCDDTTCSGTLRANLYAGMPEDLQGMLVIPVTVSRHADPITSCAKLSGTGTLRGTEFVATLVGELCGVLSVRYSINGSLQVHRNTPVCANQNEVAAVGSLQMFGAVKAPGNGLPYSSSGLVSFIGTAGQIVICGP